MPTIKLVQADAGDEEEDEEEETPHKITSNKEESSKTWLKGNYVASPSEKAKTTPQMPKNDEVPQRKGKFLVVASSVAMKAKLHLDLYPYLKNIVPEYK